MRIFVSSLAFIGFFGFVNAAEYSVDTTHSNVRFEVAHLVISTVSGRFTDFNGKLKFNEKSELIGLEGEVKAASIDTDNEKRDKHLRSEDFFHTDKHAVLKFESKPFQLKSGKESKISGSLNMRGVSKPVTFLLKFKGKVTDPWGNEKAAISATTTVNRKDFGLKWNESLETGGVLVGEDVKIILDIQASK